ncbi:MAG TPA: hypothetical protein VFQ63_01740 [Patescibacteria group bacterium]|nr:hypothetical protein [Patescibacteria group bacterium]
MAERFSPHTPSEKGQEVPLSVLYPSQDSKPDPFSTHLDGGATIHIPRIGDEVVAMDNQYHGSLGNDQES